MKPILLAALLAATTPAAISAPLQIAQLSPAAIEKSLNRDFDAKLNATYFSHKRNPHFMAKNTAHLFFTKDEASGRYGPLTLSLTLFSGEWHSVEGAYLEYNDDKVALPASLWRILPTHQLTMERTTIPLSQPKHLAIVQEMLEAKKPKVGFVGRRNAVREIPDESLVQMREVLAAYKLLTTKAKVVR